MAGAPRFDGAAVHRFCPGPQVPADAGVPEKKPEVEKVLEPKSLPSDEAAALKRLEELKEGRPLPAPKPEAKLEPAPGPAKPLSALPRPRALSSVGEAIPMVPLR